MNTPEFVARMLNTLFEGLGLAALVWLVLRVLKPLNSGTRFAVWCSTLVVIVTLPFVGRATGGSSSTGIIQAKLVLPEFLAIYLLAAWGLIACVLLVRLAISLAHVRHLRREASELRLEELDPALRNILTVTSRRACILVSDGVRVPAAIGFFRPAVILPAWAMRDLQIDDLKTILLHELAHLRRWDDWTNLLQKVLKALFFFHPAVWWIESRLSLEREMACDDMVLAELSSPKAYAASLISLAERVGLGRTAALAQAALGHARHTSLRIAQILDSKRPKGIGLWKPALGFGAAIAAIAFVAIPYAPDLVAFANPEPIREATATPAVPTLQAGMQMGAPALAHVARPGNTAVVEQKVAQRPARPHAPVSVPKALAVSTRREISQPQVVLVMQSTQFDETGTPVFTLCVWQITDRNSQQVRTEIVMRSL